MLPLVLFTILFTGALQAHAQDNNHSDHGNPPRAEVPAPPAMSDAPEPPHVYDDEEGIDGRKQVQADVTITREKEQTVEEYRINGQLYMVKITPTKGKPYYLLYKDGEHNRPIRHELEDIQTPYWKLFEW